MDQLLEIETDEDLLYDIPVQVDGVALGSLTGWTFAWELYDWSAGPDATSPLLALTSGSGAITIFNSGTGTARMSLTAAARRAAGLAIGRYWWRLRGSSPYQPPVILGCGPCVLKN